MLPKNFCFRKGLKDLTLNMLECGESERAMPDFRQVLSKSTCLKNISLEWNFFNKDPRIFGVFQVLERLKSLEALSLDFYGSEEITNKEIVSLVKVLKELPSLKKIDLSLAEQGFFFVF